MVKSPHLQKPLMKDSMRNIRDFEGLFKLRSCFLTTLDWTWTHSLSNKTWKSSAFQGLKSASLLGR